MKRYYKHRDGFSGESTGASYVEVDGQNTTFVWPNGDRRTVHRVYEQEDIDDWVEQGWWIPLEII